jgi:nitrite reductase/ring-hydroxylating ferredoxin subunit
VVPGDEGVSQVDASGVVVDQEGVPGLLVHRPSIGSRQVFDVERRTVFAHSWLYLGHESEVRQAGDYVARTVGGRPLLLLRGQDGLVRAFHNACTHLGASICSNGSGRGQYFRCFYHGWTFDTHGHLVRAPTADARASTFRREDHGLAQVPKVDSYRGLYFVCFDGDARSLRDYLGAMGAYIDRAMAMPLRTGEPLVAAADRRRIRANWKLLVETRLQVRWSRQSTSHTDGSALTSRRECHEYPSCGAGPLAPAVIADGESGSCRTAPPGPVYVGDLYVFPNLWVLADSRVTILRTFEPETGGTEVRTWALVQPGKGRDQAPLQSDDHLRAWTSLGLSRTDVAPLENEQRRLDQWATAGQRGDEGADWESVGLPGVAAFWRAWRSSIAAPGEARA